MAQNLKPELAELLTRVIEAENLEFVHGEFSGAHKNAILRVYIDKLGGVTHEDCTHISHQLSTILDVEDLIPHQYILEVSSPGIERGLYKKNDYQRFAGHPIRLKTNQPISGRRNFRGQLEGIKEDLIQLRVEKGELINIPFDAVTSANLAVDHNELFRRALEQQTEE